LDVVVSSPIAFGTERNCTSAPAMNLPAGIKSTPPKRTVPVNESDVDSAVSVGTVDFLFEAHEEQAAADVGNHAVAFAFAEAPPAAQFERGAS
jgi:hypothetical protein